MSQTWLSLPLSRKKLQHKRRTKKPCLKVHVCLSTMFERDIFSRALFFTMSPIVFPAEPCHEVLLSPAPGEGYFYACLLFIDVDRQRSQPENVCLRFVPGLVFTPPLLNVMPFLFLPTGDRMNMLRMKLFQKLLLVMSENYMLRMSAPRMP